MRMVDISLPGSEIQLSENSANMPESGTPPPLTEVPPAQSDRGPGPEPRDLQDGAPRPADQSCRLQVNRGEAGEYEGQDHWVGHHHLLSPLHLVSLDRLDLPVNNNCGLRLFNSDNLSLEVVRTGVSLLSKLGHREGFSWWTLTGKLCSE